MVEYTIDDIRGPTVAREMAQLKSFVLEKFNGAISDAEAAAAQAATDAANAVLDSLDTRVGDLESDMTTAQGDITTNAGAILALDGKAVKKTGESSQSIAGDISVSGALSAGGNATVGGNLGVTGQSVLSGNVSMPGGCSLGGSPTAPDVATGVYGTFIANANKVKNELDNYAAMVRTTGNQTIAGIKGISQLVSLPIAARTASGTKTSIASLTVSASTYYRFDMIISNKRGVGLGRIDILTDASGNISTVTWNEAAKTSTLKCSIGAYTDSGVMTLTIAGTEGGSYNAVTLLGCIGGDGYVMSPTLLTRAQVTVGADYAEAVLG